MTILLIILILFIVYLFYYFKQKHIPKNTVIAFTGGLGSGKSYLAVRESLKYYKNNMRFITFMKLIPFIGKKYKDINPLYYSSIPVYLGRIWWIIGRPMWSVMLEWEHLTLEKKINEYSAVFIDELGSIATQYDYDHPLVMEKLREFIRFFRHYIDGRLFITEQSSSDILVHIRRRVNQFYHLSDFRKILFFFFIVNVQEIHITEDVTQIKDTENIEEKPYFFGFMPPRFIYNLGLKKYNYDTRCYSINYNPNIDKKEITLWNKYKTTYFIDLPNLPAFRQLYKKQGYLKHDQVIELVKLWETRER